MDNKGDKYNIDGFIDRKVYGWRVSNKKGRLALRVDGREIFHVESDSIDRGDVRSALGLEHGRHGFEVELPRRLFDGQKRRVELLVDADDVVYVVGGKELRFDIAPGCSTPTPRTRSRAAVVCWDLAHNPAGRALVLYDILSKQYDHVDLVGPMFPRFGTEVWEPLRDLPGLNVVTQVVNDFKDLVGFAKHVSETVYDFAWICKPRFPGLLVGLSIFEANNCSIALDIDDYEMSFFKGRESREIGSDILAKLHSDKIHPADFEATVLAHRFIDCFALRTVSNISLQRTFGGCIVPHTRSASVFDPARFKRARRALRRQFLGQKTFGFLNSSQEGSGKVVLFIGTIRRHKGVLDVARAVAESGRDDMHLVVAGNYESEDLKKEIKKVAGNKVTLLGSVAFDQLPEYLSSGDVICLPQDPASETSYYQLPAKIGDGLSMGLKVIVNDLPPYDDMHDEPGIVIRGAKEELKDALLRALELDVGAEEIRQGFLRRFSSEGLALKTAFYFSDIDPSDVLRHSEKVYLGLFGRPVYLKRPVFRSGVTKPATRDLVVLWKQQDSGLFGRRVDMVSEYLLRAGVFDRVIVIDAPLSVWEIGQLGKRAAFNSLSNARLIYDAFVTRYLGKADRPGFMRRAYAYSSEAEHFLGHRTTTFDDLKERFAKTFEEVSLSEDAVLWACPVVPHFQQVIQSATFKTVVADIIDDEREFTSDPKIREKKQQNYEIVLGAADVVFTNNENMVERFSPLSRNPIHVIPNGVEKIRIEPEEIMHLEGLDPGKKVIGYLGNLRDRIDIDIIYALADADEDWHVLLVGPTGEVPEIEQLNKHRNITLAGAVSYENSRLIAAGFDVAIIPHKLTKLTDSMNPLKFYLYRELGLPIVTTPVKNLGAMDDRVFVARQGDAGHFVSCVKKAVALGKLKDRTGQCYGHIADDEYWESRVNQIKQVLNGK